MVISTCLSFADETRQLSSRHLSVNYVRVGFEVTGAKIRKFEAEKRRIILTHLTGQEGMFLR